MRKAGKKEEVACPRGIEQDSVSGCGTSDLSEGDAEEGTRCDLDVSESGYSSDLIEIISRWDQLSDSVKRAIQALACGTDASE